jgi:DNA-binding response OmpR family regulator
MRILVLDLCGASALTSAAGSHGVGDSVATILASAGHVTAVRSEPPADLTDAEVVVLAGDPIAVAELCRRIRTRDAVLPIMILTAAGMVDDRVAGLRAGADDALDVPFHPSQMVARVDALGRRARLVPPLPEVIDADGCAFDLSRCVAARGGQEIALSAREAELVRYLHRHRARAVSREEILQHVFGVSPRIETRSVDVAIGALRKKIERHPEDPRIIVAVKGIGYAWGRR